MANYNVDNKLVDNFELLREIVKNKSAEDTTVVSLDKINEIIDIKIPNELKDNAPDDFYEIYSNFKSENEKFRDFITYDKLIGKNIVALGGGFSSGKSSFLNKIMGKNILPSDIDPCTSVPTYIINGEKYETVGLNVFGAKVKMKPTDIRKLAYGFGKVLDDDSDSITDTVTLGHILNNLFFSTSYQIFKNIAFLDTPGYSKPDTKEYSDRTDENIARQQLNLSNYILWYVPADRGTITEEDIKFIRTLREDIPKLIIVSKSDNKNLSDLKDIIAKIKSTLDLKGIRYVDVLAFSDRCMDSGELGKFINKNIEQIKKYLGEWDKKKSTSSFAINFKRVFVNCRAYYEDRINEESRKLNRLNTSITRLSAEDIDLELLEPLNYLLKSSQEELRTLKGYIKTLKNLQDEFFTEIKRISDLVGIEMPEPSEIDLLSDKVSDPMAVLEEYKKKHNIKTDPKMVDLMEKTFEGITPIINTAVGGEDYKNKLIDSMKSILDIKKEDIKIFDDRITTDNILKNVKDNKLSQLHSK